MAGFATLKGSWPWPWIGSYSIPSCITHPPIPTRQIWFKLKKHLWTVGRTDVRTHARTDGRIFETGFIRSTPSKSRPKNSGHVTLTTPISGVLYHPKSIGIDIVYPYAKYDHGREKWGAAGAAAPQNNDWGGRICILPPPPKKNKLFEWLDIIIWFIALVYAIISNVPAHEKYCTYNR